MITIKCRTLFDITNTGVVGHFKSSRIHYQDAEAWNRARNQQRNWETLTQLIQLRTQISDITPPIETDGIWSFEFSTETPGVFGSDADPTEILRSDADGVPMLRELNNDPNIETILVTSGPTQNIWFDLISINN